MDSSFSMDKARIHCQTREKILSLAYFLILNQNNNVSFYESFAETTRLPYPRPLSPSAVTRLFQRIELRDVRRYFLLMRSYLQEDEDNKIILALDSTSISSYSTRLTHIEYGKNKDDDALPQLNVLFLVDQKSGLPSLIVIFVPPYWFMPVALSKS